MTHAAMNLITGEVITANRSSHLKRCVARRTRYDVAHGFGAGKWVFAHSKDWGNALYSKFAKANSLAH